MHRRNIHSISYLQHQRKQRTLTNTSLLPSFFGKQNDKGVQTGALPTLDPRTFFPLRGRDWSRFFQKYCDNPLYKVYVRIVVSAYGFSEPVCKAVWDYNQSAHGLFQPIILYKARVQDFGELSQILGKSKPQGSQSSQIAWKDFNDFAIPHQHVIFSSVCAICLSFVNLWDKDKQEEENYNNEDNL